MSDTDRTELLTSRETASMLRVPVRTLYLWRASGSGPPAYRVGKRTLYRRSDVESWLEECRVAAPA